ncbi:MAG TPA: hypothetical protein ENH31_00455 [Nitrospirae bacterium]|nr:hypothetical protein [Nitrospirota bacterium]HDK41416.1 hypothetical protein [Nitrospirota bacterium]HDK81023.1 hypothetical protein [Nitrospirota bacterium]
MNNRPIDRHSMRLWDDMRKATECQSCGPMKLLLRVGFTTLYLPRLDIDGRSDQACPGRGAFADMVFIEINNCPTCGEPLRD